MEFTFDARCQPVASRCHRCFAGAMATTVPSLQELSNDHEITSPHTPWCRVSCWSPAWPSPRRGRADRADHHGNASGDGVRAGRFRSVLGHTLRTCTPDPDYGIRHQIAIRSPATAFSARENPSPPGRPPAPLPVTFPNHAQPCIRMNESIVAAKPIVAAAALALMWLLEGLIPMFEGRERRVRHDAPNLVLGVANALIVSLVLRRGHAGRDRMGAHEFLRGPPLAGHRGRPRLRARLRPLRPLAIPLAPAESPRAVALALPRRPSRRP